MSTMSTQSVGGVARQGSGRLAVASAIAFAVLFVVAIFLVAPVDTDQDDAGLIADVEDNSMAMMIGIYAGVLAALAFLVVAATLLRRLAAALVDADLTVARGAAMLGTVGLALGPAIMGALVRPICSARRIALSTRASFASSRTSGTSRS